MTQKLAAGHWLGVGVALLCTYMIFVMKNSSGITGYVINSLHFTEKTNKAQRMKHMPTDTQQKDLFSSLLGNQVFSMLMLSVC